MKSQRDEKDADLRNKLQACRTILEMLFKDEKPPKYLVKIALKDLESLLKVTKKRKTK